MVKVQLKGHNIILRPCFVAREITQPGRLSKVPLIPDRPEGLQRSL